MGKPTTENSKKAAGNAKKAAVKADKAAAEAAKQAAVEDQEWQKGSKSSAKKEAEANKKADLARKKAERDQQLAEEEASLPSKPKGTVKASAAKKPSKPAPARKLDLDALNGDDSSKAAPTLNATGIDDALDALDLSSATPGGDKVEKHPERRFKAAYAAYEARRMPEVEEESPGLRRQQRSDLIRKEFERSAENPFNQVRAEYNASKEEVAEVRRGEREKVERRLGEKS